MISGLLKSLSFVGSEMGRAYSRTNDWQSFARYSTDLFLIRTYSALRLPAHNRRRKIIMRDGTAVHYRFNRGDIWSLHEILLAEAYRLPFERSIRTIVDLGANIGLCSIWLAKRYNAEFVLSVEPVPSNCEVVGANLADNKIPGKLLQAAVGPNDGVVKFQETDSSNFGRIDQSGSLEVTMHSMDTVLKELPERGTVIDLLKMDIEGGEEDLLCNGDLGWLEQVQAIIAEFHPDLIDYPRLLELLQSKGFRHIPAGSAFPEQMDCFVRDSERK